MPRRRTEFTTIMSTSNQTGSSEIDLDLHFLPAWAQRSSAENQYAKFEGGGDRSETRGDRRGPRDFRRDGPPRDRKFSGGGPRREGARPPMKRHDRPGGPPEDRREPLPPPAQITVNLIPEIKGVEALARQIRLTGRAYPLFDIGFLILKKPDRYDVQFNVIKGADGKPVQPLFLCELDESLWLSEQAAVDHALDKHFGTFYQTEKIPTDPPKGVYTFVGQCGMSGIVLGPPNYHDYQNKLRKLHQERFARVPFEVFKSRVKIVKDEAVVKKWVEEQSFRFEYTCLNVPETVKLNSREEVEKHFRATHLPVVIKPVESRTLSGPALHNQPNPALKNLARRAWEEQNRFPLKLVNVLSQQFAGLGLHFFKVNKTITHVSVARPRFLDVENTSMSDGIRRIVEFIQNHPGSNRRQLLETLAPDAPASASAATAPAEGAPAPAASPQAEAVNRDLHWLVHEGHVIEFANGRLELAKKPAPRPPKPDKPAPAASSAGPAPASNPEAGNATADSGSEEVSPGELPEAASETAQPAVLETTAAEAVAIPDRVEPGTENVSPVTQVESRSPTNP